MNRPLRKALYRYLTLASLLSAVIAAGSLWIIGEINYRTYYSRLEQEGFKNVKDRLALFDTIISRLELDAAQNGEKALRILGSRYRSMADVRAADTESLAAEAKSLGVSEIYFIGTDGKIVASSFSADIGLDLFSLGTLFGNGLKSLFGSGRVADQRLSQSTKTGIISAYQYYGPAGTDFLIEVSTKVSDRIPEFYLGNNYAKLIRFAFSSDLQNQEKASIRMVDLLGESGSILWSLLNEGGQRNEYASLIADRDAGGTGRRITGGVETVIYSVPLSSLGSPVVHSRRFAVIEIDRRELFRFRIVAVIVFVLACLIAVSVSILLVRRRLGYRLAARVERLEASLAMVASSGVPFEFDDPVEDEIASIARSAGSIVSDLRAQASHLQALLAEQTALQQEIHHRVKNNLQVILSLIGLQIDVDRDPSVHRALAATKSRLYAMSLVLDRLYVQDSVEKLPLDEFLRDICLYLNGAYHRSDLTVYYDTDGDGLFLSPDAAVPVGLLLGEIISNSLNHAFPGRTTGRISVRAAASEGKGFRLTVSDDGIGGDMGTERVGMTVIRALAAQLGCFPRITIDGGRRIDLELSAALVSGRIDAGTEERS